MKFHIHPLYPHAPHHGARYYLALAAGLLLPAVVYLVWTYMTVR